MVGKLLPDSGFSVIPVVLHSLKNYSSHKTRSVSVADSTYDFDAAESTSGRCLLSERLICSLNLYLLCL